MTEERHRGRRVLKALVRLDENATIERKGRSRYDATRPSFLIFTAIAYAAAVFFIIIGVPLRGVSTKPIPQEDLPYAIPIFILVYVVIVGGLYLRDRLRKKP
ncbi:MAG: hypothetical protein AB1512_04065 [Thermodesulfobacteriota bacterium]